jgi:hypothetical protein
MQCFIIGLDEGGKIMARSRRTVETKAIMGEIAPKPGSYALDIIRFPAKLFRLGLEVEDMIICVFDPTPSATLVRGNTLSAEIKGDDKLWTKEEVGHYKI